MQNPNNTPIPNPMLFLHKQQDKTLKADYAYLTGGPPYALCGTFHDPPSYSCPPAPYSYPCVCPICCGPIIPLCCTGGAGTGA